jgi:DNA-directed RNA polymerase subunit RPC12/RpoP
VILAKPGGWYFFVACASCGKPIMFKEASSLEEDEQPAGATLTCPHCGAEHSYLASQVQRGRVDEKGASTAGRNAKSVGRAWRRR